MKNSHLFATLFILACTAAAWFLLGTALSHRTDVSSHKLRAEVAGVWGPALVQEHPQAWYETPNAPNGRARLLPIESKVEISLDSDPKRRGLLWHRTYQVGFQGEYRFENPTRIPQTLYIFFPLPRDSAGLHSFQFRLGEEQADPSLRPPGQSGGVTRAVRLDAGESIRLQTGYRTRGTDDWRYHFPDRSRITGFQLAMKTNFAEIDFPVGTGSPGQRKRQGDAYALGWDFPDVLAAPDIGMAMPNQLNAGPVAARIAFFAPVSLLFFTTVLLLSASALRKPLHPMHVFFVAAGFFAFHLLFAYLVDLLALPYAFALASLTSLGLVCGYLRTVGGGRLLRVALPTQAIYLVAFSASFFIDGLTGITLAVLAILTLAVLMILTARTDWREFFQRPASLPKEARPTARA